MRHQPAEFYELLDELSACRTLQIKLALRLLVIRIVRIIN